MDGFHDVVWQLMTDRGYTLRGLAAAAGYDPSYLSKVIRGAKPRGPDITRRLDEILDAGRQVRDAADACTRPPVHYDQEEAVAPELVTYFRGQLAGHYQADMYLGPRLLIPTVQAQYELLAGLIDRADDVVRHGLLDTGAAYAALLGWLHQDSGNVAESARWRDITLSLAHRSGDPALISYSLTNKAMLALDLGNGRAVVDYAQAALADAERLPAKCRVLAIQHQAQGRAMLRDRRTADRLLDAAETLAGKVDDEYPWGNACRRTPSYVTVQRATSYSRTNRHADAGDAVGLWDEILDAMPDSARRDNAVFRARQAQAAAQLPDPDRTIELAAIAVAAVQPTGSQRLRQELAAVRDKARPWARTTAGRQLNEVLAGTV